MSFHRRALSVALGVALVAAPLTAFVASPAQAVDVDIRINEVSSDPTDFVELVNLGDTPVELAGWTVVDNDPERTPVVIAAPSTVLAPGGLFSFQLTAIGGPGLGKGDSVTIATAGGTTIDTYTWPAGVHAAPSHGRCGGSATLVKNDAATPGAANDCPEPSVILNEVSSDNPDLVELYNDGVVDADITGWTVVDNDPLHTPAVITAEPTVLQPGEYFTFTPDELTGGFGLGNSDSVTIFDGLGAQVDSFDWAFLEGHATPSYGACPNGTGAAELVKNTARTPGAANACALPDGAGDIKINEVSSDPTDWIELVNVGSSTVDVSGWQLSDDAGTTDPTHLQAIPGGTVVEPGGYLALDYTAAGLGKGDTANLYLSDNTLVDTTQWPADVHATTWGRCADGTGAFQTTTATKGAVNDCTVAPPATLDPRWDDVEINEIASLNDDDEGNPGFGDAVELSNTGTQPVSIQGWWQTDGGAATGAAALTLADLKVWNGTALEPAADWTIPAGGYVAFSSKKGLSGEGDAVKIYGPGADATSRQLVDSASYGDGDAGVSDSYTSDARAFAACPNGSDEFWRVTANSFGQDNTASCSTKSRRLATPIVLNEVSNVSQKAELLNTGSAAVDITGWELLDASGAVVHTVPASTSVAPGAFYLAEGLVGLDSADALTIRDGDGASVVAHTWYEDGIASYSRCELFGSISYVETPTATWGAANACPALVTETWPGASTITTVDEVDGFGDGDGNGEGDVSGATFDPVDPSILWVVQNKNTLHKMHKVGGTYVALDGWAGGKKLHFADGTGAVDSEGVAAGPDGSVYVTSERDNSNSNVSYNKVLRYDVSAVGASTTSLTAVSEWDVNGSVVTGTNLGLEGIAYVPDAFLVKSGWKVGGSAYTAAAYSTPGLFVTAVEGTGSLHFFSLANGADPVEVKVESSGFPFAMDVAYDEDRGALWSLCDDSCGGVYNLLKVVNGDFAVEHSYARPAGMPNLNNEGMAIARASTCTNGEQEVVWTDDGDTGGYSLRAGTLPCPPKAPVIVDVAITKAPVITGQAVVGKTLTASVPVTSPTGATITYQWSANKKPIGGASTRTFKVGAAQVGKTITVTARATLAGRTASATSAATVKVVKAKATVKASVKAGKVKHSKSKATKKAKKKATVTVAVSNPDNVAVTGTVKVSGRGVKTVTGTVRNGKVTLKLGPFTKKGKVKLTITYLGSSSLSGATTKATVKVVK